MYNKFYMVVLALDTTARRGSVALLRDGHVAGTFAGDALITHGERLPGDLVRLLSEHALTVRDVELFAVAAGPGSLTGLRIGIATLQGLALANNRPLVGVSALDAWNHAARSALCPLPSALSGNEIAVWMDAQRGEVFSARYVGDRVSEGPTVEKPAAILDRWTAHGAPAMFVGDGAVTYAQLINDAFPEAEILVDVPLLAASIASLAEAIVVRDGAAPPDALRPIYIRRSDAELARDRKVGLQPS
jgi:tRNA threonylcarbamoyladenosine biosynthesis protein TsaB